MRIASRPSRNMMMNDWVNRLTADELVAQHSLRVLEPGLELAPEGVELGRRGPACRPRPKRRERRLELGGQPGVLGPNAALDLLECHVGVERARAGRGIARAGERGTPSRAGRGPGRRPWPSRPPCGRPGRSAPPRAGPAPRRSSILHAERREDAGRPTWRRGGEGAERRRHIAPGRRERAGAGVHRGRPAVLGGQPALERRHRGADGSDGDAAVVIERETSRSAARSARFAGAGSSPAAIGPSPRPTAP